MLNNLPSPKTKQSSKRLGRGMGSGVGGHTVGRGNKGQTARSGHKSPRPGFEGGQNPISRRLPKYKGESRGTTRATFTSRIQNVPLQLSKVVEIAELNNDFDLNIEKLIEFGLIKPKFSKDLNVKILFDKEIKQKISITGILADEKAIQKEKRKNSF
jgi:large subunit ribosomal protein L15